MRTLVGDVMGTWQRLSGAMRWLLVLTVLDALALAALTVRLAGAGLLGALWPLVLVLGLLPASLGVITAAGIHAGRRRLSLGRSRRDH